MNNLLLQEFKTPFGTPPFDQLKPQDFLPALKNAITTAKEEVESIIKNPSEATFENTIEALESSGELVGRISSIFFNLNSAETNDEIQKIAREISPLLSEYSNDIILNHALFLRIKKVYDQRTHLFLSAEAKTLLDKTYKSFVRNGANLSDENKERLRTIDKTLSQRSLEFGENVLKETNDFVLLVKDKEDLSGLPEDLIEAAALTAKESGKEGWIFTLHYPSYVPFMTYADNRELREKLFKAYGSKAYKGDENDNQQIILEIVRLRQERAALLGYACHADFVLEERMA